MANEKSTKHFGGEIGETTFSLLGKTKDTLKQNSKLRTCLNRLLITVIIITILVGLLSFLCFADTAKSMRCGATDKLGLQLEECVEAAILGKKKNKNVVLCRQNKVLVKRWIQEW